MWSLIWSLGWALSSVQHGLPSSRSYNLESLCFDCMLFRRRCKIPKLNRPCFRTTPSDNRDGNTWFWFDLAGTGPKFRWCCLPCADHYGIDDGFHSNKPQLSNLLYHQSSDRHRRALSVMLQRQELLRITINT